MPLTKKESKVRCSAEDCDDLLKESVPYRILIVRPDNPAVCGVCSWESLCSGCELTSKTSECVLKEDARLVIHWETVALHFMYKEPVIQRGELQSTSKGKRYTTKYILTYSIYKIKIIIKISM